MVQVIMRRSQYLSMPVIVFGSSSLLSAFLRLPGQSTAGIPYMAAISCALGQSPGRTLLKTQRQTKIKPAPCCFPMLHDD